jgi:tetratricopeptide (TPR) repeat protein
MAWRSTTGWRFRNGHRLPPVERDGQCRQTKQELTMRRALALSSLLCVGIAMNLFAVGEARLSGKILEAGTKKPLTDAIITVVSAPGTGKNFKNTYKAEKDGSYAIFLLDGTIKYVFTFSAPGHTPYEETMKLKLGEPNKRDIELSAGAAVPAAPAKTVVDPAITAYNDGAALANDGKEAEAIAKMEEAVTLKPDLTAGYNALAKLYLRAKNYPKAIDRATKSLAVDAEDEDMNAVLFEAYTATGDKAKADEYKKKLPANPSLLFNDAAKLINAGKDMDAEPLLKQAIAADGKFAVAYYELGMIYARIGKAADAKANLQKYLELEPTGKEAATAKEMMKYLK